MTPRTLEPFRALVVRPDAADRVVSGPYDGYSAVERRAVVAAEPLSYLNVTRTPEDLDDGQTIDDLEDLVRHAMDRIVAADVYRTVDEPSLYLYELSEGAHVQRGLVGLSPVDAFADGRIRKHEGFRPERATLLAQHMLSIGGTSSPIALSFRSWGDFDARLDALAAGEPLLDHRAGDVRQRVWAIGGIDAERLTSSLAEVTLYVTDGHHRVAAATLARQLGAGRGPDAPVGRELDRALTVVFPDRHLQVLAFHRLVRDRHRRPVERIVDDLAAVGFTATEADTLAAARPEGPGEVAMYADGRWFRLRLRAAEGTRAVDRLDVQRLQDQLLEPVFGIVDAGADPALTYVPGTVDDDEFTARCDRVEGTVGFVLHRTGIDELFAVADEGDLMPPKSSYFAPKPRSGVFIRSLGVGPLARYGSSLEG